MAKRTKDRLQVGALVVAVLLATVSAFFAINEHSTNNRLRHQVGQLHHQIHQLHVQKQKSDRHVKKLLHQVHGLQQQIIHIERTHHLKVTVRVSQPHPKARSHTHHVTHRLPPRHVVPPPHGKGHKSPPPVHNPLPVPVPVPHPHPHPVAGIIHHVTQTLGQTTHAATQTIRHTIHNATKTVHQIVHSATNTVGHVVHSATNTVNSTTHTVTHGACSVLHPLVNC